MLRGKAALAILAVVATAIFSLTLYTSLQTASKGASTGSSTGGAILPISSNTVPSTEEAARALNASP